MHEFNLPCGRLVAPAKYTVTGTRITGVRPGFSQFDDWGHVEGVRRGLACSTDGYCLDAPEQMASGASKGFIAVRDITRPVRVLYLNPTFCDRS